MLYLVLGLIIVAFVVILVVAYKSTKKTIVLNADGTKFEINNKGTHFVVTINDEFTVDYEMPQLFKGERAEVKVPDPNNKYDEDGNVIGEAKTIEYVFFAKSNYFGNKIYITIYDKDNNIVATNNPKQ